MKIKSFLPLFCVVGFVGLCLWSCKSIQSHSEIPEIHFKKLVFVDSLDALDEILKKAVITFSFIDGDGDLGDWSTEKYPDEGVSRIYYTWYEKKHDKTYEPYQFKGGTTNFSKIPYSSVMDKSEAQNKTLKGFIDIKLDAPVKPQGIDTMRIEFYINDRAGNLSNVEYTPDFSILNPPDELLPE